MPSRTMWLLLILLMMLMGSLAGEDEEGVFLFLRQPQAQKRKGSAYRHVGISMQFPVASCTSPTTGST